MKKKKLGTIKDPSELFKTIPFNQEITQRKEN